MIWKKKLVITGFLIFAAYAFALMQIGIDYIASIFKQWIIIIYGLGLIAFALGLTIGYVDKEDAKC